MLHASTWRHSKERADMQEHPFKARSGSGMQGCDRGIHRVDAPGPCEVRAKLNRDTVESTRYELECGLRFEGQAVTAVRRVCMRTSGVTVTPHYQVHRRGATKGSMDVYPLSGLHHDMPYLSG